MKVVLLAGGLGTRIMEETRLRPKPMVEIGGEPILRHIMQCYADQGFTEFVVALGYKGDVVRDYFDAHPASDWTVDLIDTGESTMTGGRIQRLRHVLEGTFMATYGDGLADIDLEALLAFHRSHGRVATLTAVRPPDRVLRMELDGNRVACLKQQEQGEGWINGGFFVFEPAIFDYLGGDSDPLESVALTRLAADGELMAYHHDGFWQCMDNVAERDLLERLWAGGSPPWARLRRPALT